MRYCYQCNRVTQGEPLFCQFCGRTYSVKLCPRLHKNPRVAEICSQCGSRDLSIPAPKQPFWVSFAVFVLSLVPGFLLILITLLLIVIGLQVLLTNPRMLLSFGFLALAVMALWAIWTKLPLFLRRWIRKQLLEREKERKP